MSSTVRIATTSPAPPRYKPSVRLNPSTLGTRSATALFLAVQNSQVCVAVQAHCMAVVGCLAERNFGRSVRVRKHVSKRITLLFLLSMPVASAGYARDQFVLGLRAERQGDRFSAAYHYREVLREKPDHPAAGSGLARQHVTAGEALKLTRNSKAKQRARGVKGILSLGGPARFRALLIALRNPRLDVRMPVMNALGQGGDMRAVKPLLLRLVTAGGNPQSAYIAQTRQVSYIQDFDVEVA